MKNIQVIDGAINSIYEIYEVSDDIFQEIFPGNINVAFADDVREKIEIKFGNKFWDEFYRKRVKKEKVRGIHGTFHLPLSNVAKECFPTRREEEVTSGGFV